VLYFHWISRITQLLKNLMTKIGAVCQMTEQLPAPGNYRPVSLTCVLCKVLESIIRDALVGYLESAVLYVIHSMGLGRVVRV